MESGGGWVQCRWDAGSRAMCQAPGLAFAHVPKASRWAWIRAVDLRIGLIPCRFPHRGNARLLGCRRSFGDSFTGYATGLREDPWDMSMLDMVNGCEMSEFERCDKTSTLTRMGDVLQ